MTDRAKQKPVIGKYTLDTISIGMYNNPLMLFREYVQNSVDAIDEAIASQGLEMGDARILIGVDGRARALAIQDNATGIPADDVWRRLNNVGSSTKKAQLDRGFRGIGRLGGLGYCQKLTFTTKARGEKVYSINSWDCAKLRALINEENGGADVADIIASVSKVRQSRYDGNRDDHFFRVEMEDVKSPRDVLLNVPIIRSYLSQVAPVPFNKNIFSYTNEVDYELRSRVPGYETYRIDVNGERMFKPYSDHIRLGQDRYDKIQGIDFQELYNHTSVLAFGWLARTGFKGVVNQTSCVEGIRVRSGNIQIGDKELLAGFFRERRFNNYIVGELHVSNSNLVPNSRRDDFEDNRTKEEFYESFVKGIGLPVSREIRKSSEERSNNNRQQLHNHLMEQARNIVANGHLSEKHKEAVMKHITSLKLDQDILQELVRAIRTSKHYLDHGNKKYTGQKKDFYKSIFEIIFTSASSYREAEKIVQSIIDKLAL